MTVKENISSTTALSILAALSITSMVGLGAFVSSLPRIEERDLNKDGKLDYVVSKSGEPRKYFISRSDGMYEPGELVAEHGVGFIKSTTDRGAFYTFGGMEKVGTNLVYHSDRIFRVAAPVKKD